MVGNNEVVVTNIKMPFLSMVIFMVKWAIASLPAIVILVTIGAMVVQIISALTGMMGGAGGKNWHQYF